MLIKALVSLINLIIRAIAKAAEVALMLLPDSPFEFIEKIELDYIDTLNWVIPFDFMFVVLSYWVTAILVFYGLQIILRWVKVIE